MKWTPKNVSKFGANVAVIGSIGSGKTVLQEEFAERVYDGTFKIWVHASKEVFRNDWTGNGDAVIHRRRATFQSKRFDYLKRGYENSLVFLEDLPSWAKGEQQHSERTDQVTLNNFLSTIRHRRSVFFASAQSLLDFFEILSQQVLTKFTHYVIFKSTESMLRLKKIGLGTGSCYFVERLVRRLEPYKCIVLDLRQNLVTNPFSNIEVGILKNLTLRESNDFEVKKIEIVEKEKNGNAGKRKVPLSQTAFAIREKLKNEPNTDLREFAKELGMNKGTMYNWVNRLKKRGYLDAGVRYGSPRK